MRKRLRKKKDKQEVIKMVNNGMLDDIVWVDIDGPYKSIKNYPLPEYNKEHMQASCREYDY
jgi:hypothetical protein